MSGSSVARKWGLLCRSSALVLAAVVAMPAEAAASPASAEAPPPAYVDYCLGQCHDILAGGQGGGVPTWKFLANLNPLNSRTDNTSDQSNRYDLLSTNYSNLTDSQISQFMYSSSFGIPPGHTPKFVAPSGRTDVTITRDNLGIPHIKGTTRDGTTYGVGYATAEDRLWMMDLMRHMANGSAVKFAGESAREFEEQLWPEIAQTEAEMQDQVTRLAASGPEGRQVVRDLESYVAGINGYIKDVENPLGPLDPGLKIPIEYKGTGNVGPVARSGIKPFKVIDAVALGNMMGGQFGSGGGNQVAAAVTKIAAEQRYGRELGAKVWDSLRAANDPESVVTQRGAPKAEFGNRPADPQYVAMPDAASVTKEPLRIGDNTTTQVSPASEISSKPKPGMSNALVVSGEHTKSGNPIAVFGPQVGYFAPQLLMVMEIQGPGLSARGAAFPGTGPYVLLGRGQDYSWSATSAHQGISDTYALKLCNADGSVASKQSSGYLDNGKCVQMEQLTSPDNLRIWRTKYGIVSHRAAIDGAPVAYAKLRSTYRHELASAVGFMRFNSPEYLTGPEKFQEAASAIDLTFNWFYVDAANTAFYNSGLQPIRQNVDPNLPMWAGPATEWRNWEPSTNTVRGVPSDQHPQSINQDYYVSWNNKTAVGQTYAGFGAGSVHRGDLLDTRVKKLIADGNKVDRAALTKVMAETAITDLRGEEILPNLLSLLNSDPSRVDPALQPALTALQAWADRGAKRTTKPGEKTYLDYEAIKIMDAWWPLLVKAMFKPGMGDQLYDAMVATLQIDEAPSHNRQHRGSAFEKGWWSYVDKELRTVLGQQVKAPMGTSFCGTKENCRDILATTLTEAMKKPSKDVYPADDKCAAGDSWCADSIQFKAMGAIETPGIAWQNRPTYQQVVEFPAHR